jgi:radical SAM protein with 4Fe4S-binding SPASM domain
MQYRHVLVRTELDVDTVLLYAPTLARAWIVARSSDPGSEYIESETPLTTSPQHLDLTLLLSYQCNLRCVYCYEGHAEEDVLSLETAQQIVGDLIERHDDDTQRIILGYFGGEPTLHPDLMVEFSAWIRKTYPNKSLMLAMTTNGVMSTYMRERLWQCVDKIKFSFDGPVDVQDAHRQTLAGSSSYERAFGMMRSVYQERPSAMSLRTTVTSSSVDRMVDIVKFFGRNFPGIRQQYEPVMDSCFADGVVSTVDMSRFVMRYLEAFAVAREMGQTITTSFARFSRYHDSVNKFCGVASLKYTVLPDGSLASCNRVHSSNVRQGPFFLAEPGNHLSIERPRYNLPLACHNCFARYNCKGGCYALRHSLSVGPDDEFTFCNDIRRLVTGVITHDVKKGG